MSGNTNEEWKQLIREVKAWDAYPVEVNTGNHISLNDFIEDLSKRYLLIPYDEKQTEL